MASRAKKPPTKAERVQGWITWNNFLRCAGLAGITYQTVWQSADRPTLLLLFGAMIGLPSFLPSSKDK